ncbi:MAG: metal-dependent transcriptional regulator [Armatimonadota bacterium]
MVTSNVKYEVTPQAEEYLEAVCRILDRGEVATPTELARELEISPPSALGMIRRMADQQLLTYSRQEGARLTEQGQERADILRRRHRLAERLLTDLLGVPWERVHDIACRFEHVIDEEVEPYLATALDHPTTCPHGNPLDAAAEDRWEPLTSLQPGQTGCLRRVIDETEPTLGYLAQLGLRPGANVLVCAQAPFDGPLTVEINSERHALSRAMADCLLVEVVK